MKIHKAPQITDFTQKVVIRIARNEAEETAANLLVNRNYIEDGFWTHDEQQLRNNFFLHSPNRTVFVVFACGRLVGTMSVVSDSKEGQPSDRTQEKQVNQLRKPSTKIAEVSAFAMDRAKCSHRKLVMFLVSYVLQHCFYHAGFDRLIGSCTPEHANFYESVLCFSKIGAPVYYSYSRSTGYLISLDLIEAHRLLWQRFPSDPDTGESLYRFLLCDPQPCHYFPTSEFARSRRVNWLELSLDQAA